MDKVFINREDASNKFWGYTQDPNNWNVEVRWGRLGLDGQKQLKSFSNAYDRDKFVQDKVNEKINGMYSEVTCEEFEVQSSISKTLGVGHKIDEICFVEESGQHISELSAKELHQPNTKPKVYARVVGRRAAGADAAPVTVFLFDVNEAYRIKVGKLSAGRIPKSPKFQILDKVQIMPGDEDAKLAAAVGEVIGRVLL